MSETVCAESTSEFPPVLSDGPVIDLLGGNLATLVPLRSQPTDYGGAVRAGGLNCIHVSLGVHSRDIKEILNEFDAYCLFEQMSHKLVHVERVGDIDEARKSGRLGVILGVQGLDFLQDNTRFIPIHHRLGLRVAGLTYNERNMVGSGCMEPEDTGLTLVGRRMVRELRRAGIVLDLSHAGHRTSMDAIELFDGPVVFSHSNADAITPNPRNLKSDQIKAAAASGGVVGVGSYSPFCHRKGKERPDLDDVFDHIDYVAELVGPQHVAIGTDITPQSKVKWENATRRMYPEMVGPYLLETEYAYGLETHAEFPVVPEGLRRRGYSEQEIEGILGANFVRVCQQVWK